MVIYHSVLILLALYVDTCLSCLGKKFFVTYPMIKLHKLTVIVSLYTYQKDVTIRRVDTFQYKPENRPNITLPRFKVFTLRLQYNATMFGWNNAIYYAILFESDKDFGVNLFLLGLDHSISTMTMIPVEYHGTEYYPFFLSKNQVFIALFQKLNKSASLQISYYTSNKEIRTFHAGIDLHWFPYECDNYEGKPSEYYTTMVTTAVGLPLTTKGGTAAVIVGNCKVEVKRVGDSATCSVMKSDDLIDMSLAAQFGAKEFIAFKGIHNEPDRAYITVMGLQDSTSVTVYYENEAHVQIEIQKQKTARVNLRDPFQLITSSRAIQVYLIFTSFCKENEFGGPSMTSLIPNALFQSHYIWSLPYYLKYTKHNYFVVIVRANLDYGFIFNGNNSATEKWPWKYVSGTDNWIASEVEINTLWEVYTLSSSNNRAFGLYLYGVDIAIAYIHFVDFMNAVTYRHQYICSKTDMVVGDKVDNDCDGSPDEESSVSSDDDGDGQSGEDVRSPIPNFFDQELTPPPTKPTTTRITERTTENTQVPIVSMTEDIQNVPVTTGTETTTVSEDETSEDPLKPMNQTAEHSLNEATEIPLIETTEQVTWQSNTTNKTEREHMDTNDNQDSNPPYGHPSPAQWYLWLFLLLLIPMLLIILKLSRKKTVPVAT